MVSWRWVVPVFRREGGRYGMVLREYERRTEGVDGEGSGRK